MSGVERISVCRRFVFADQIERAIPSANGAVSYRKHSVKGLLAARARGTLLRPRRVRIELEGQLLPEFANGLSCSPAYANKEVAEKETYQLAVHWHFIVVQCSDEIVRCETIFLRMFEQHSVDPSVERLF
jgi:hypothetical protein